MWASRVMDEDTVHVLISSQDSKSNPRLAPWRILVKHCWRRDMLLLP
jgi:hypothetical protein